jgi:predicted 3-demethylubiquinone-9 3-methyltransferase (glyoxalase superfamily)
MQKIHPYLWFDNQAEEAATFYTSVFKNSKITDVQRYPEAVPERAGTVMVVAFELEGLQFTALNGGPEFTFNESISLYVDCQDQAEVDELWEKLTADGGEPGPCGWLKDRFGVSWQIIPSTLIELMTDPDPEKANRVAQAMLKMHKIDVQALRDAYEQP